MPAESRFRLERPFDIAEAFAQRRSGPLGALIDEPTVPFGSPARLRALATPAQQRRLGFGATAREGFFGRGLGASSFRTPRRGHENMAATAAGGFGRRRGRASNSVLPSWYPRTPLRDITAITRAIERRRARLREENGETAESQVPSPQVQAGPLEHEVPPTTPSTVVKKRPCPPPSVRRVQKILQEVANQPDEGEFTTPQKKLLNSIDKVEKVVLEELERQKRTPMAKKAERDRR